MESTIRLFLVGADARVKRGLAMRLASEPDFVVVGEAFDAATAASSVGALQPGVIVLDLGARDTSGCIALDQLRELARACPVVALSIDDDCHLQVKARRAGAAALVAKHGDPDQLISAIRLVADDSRRERCK